MASFNVFGLDELEMTFEKLAQLPASVTDAMLHAEADVIIPAHKAAAPKRTGKLAESIAEDKKIRRTGTGSAMIIYPQGTHHVSKGKYRNKRGGARNAPNAEVGFIYEFGAPGRNIPAREWMERANERKGDEAVKAAEKVYDDWLDGI